MTLPAEVVSWVQEGERLFGRALAALQQVEHLASENRQLREELQEARAELERLRGERVEAAETMKAIAEHVTRLATVALQRLGRPLV
jgi:predicted  nucleic acid-binding Zn-ribbon protein